MFLELGLQAVLGMIPYWHGIESVQGCEGHVIAKKRVMSPPLALCD